MSAGLELEGSPLDEVVEMSGAPILPVVARRDFFKALGCGVLAICVAPALGQESGRRGRGAASNGLSAWIHIAEDDGIEAFQLGPALRKADEVDTPVRKAKLHERGPARERRREAVARIILQHAPQRGRVTMDVRDAQKPHAPVYITSPARAGS